MYLPTTLLQESSWTAKAKSLFDPLKAVLRRRGAGRPFRTPRSAARQYSLGLAMFIVVSLLNLWLHKWLGYQTIALVYLLAVVLLALFVSRGPILFGTALTAAGWRFLFAPPRFSFGIADSYDEIMFATYFVVALTVGQLMARLRAHRDAEMKAKVVAESDRLGRMLLNCVSHEFRTPIAAIASAAHSLRASNALTAAEQTLATEIESASARLNRVVQSLLNAARLQSGNLHPKLDWCDVADLTRVALGNARPLLANHPVEMRIANNLPLVKADFVLMEQALTNLIVNASAHTPPGTPIEIEARCERGFVLLEVADRGPGLPADQLERIFEPFYRAPAATPGGTGLGLSIVKGFVEAQGGIVEAANRRGGGAAFCINLPAADQPYVPDEHS